MNCEHALRVLDAGLDGELDRATTTELEGISPPARPARSIEATGEALREALRGAPRSRASGTSQAGDPRGDRPKPAVPPRPARRSLSWASAAALAGVAALAALLLGLVDGAFRRWTTDRVTSWLAVTPGRWRSAAASTTSPRATVTCSSPGLRARSTSRRRYAISPRRASRSWVPGSTEIAGRPVAVVVYRIRRHDISLFVSRSASSLPRP